MATADDASDNPGYAAGDGYLNFVGAFDSSNTFSSVSFYGDGAGEYLVAGGTIRYGTVDIGSVPEPALRTVTWAMMLAGFGLIGALRSRRKRKIKLSYA